MSSHFHFHNDRKLSSNTINSSLPSQARLTICFQLPGSCLSFKWKNATTVTSPHFPFHDDRRLSYREAQRLTQIHYCLQRSLRGLIAAWYHFKEPKRFARSLRDYVALKKPSSEKLSLHSAHTGSGCPPSRCYSPDLIRVTLTELWVQ